MVGQHDKDCSCHLCLPGSVPSNPAYEESHAEDHIEHNDGPTATPEEQAAHEAESQHPENIYNIKGRIANHARARGAHLTNMGEALCNMHAHNMKELYIFAQAIDPFWAERLRELLRKQEEMPANLIALQPKR